MHSVASLALGRLVTAGEELCIFPQNIREFWNVATRPEAQNGLGFSIAQIQAEVLRIESAFKLLEDGLSVYREWRQLVLSSQVSGTEVHDCYIAAGMRVRKVERLLTFNTSDFQRYGITVVDPRNV
jgi:predicted nucleic acid-binding protein